MSDHPDLVRALEALAREVRILFAHVERTDIDDWHLRAKKFEDDLQALREHAAPGPVDGLLPCPFCGTSAKAGFNFGRPSVDCEECGAGSGRANSGKEAIEAWNRRASPAPTDALRKVTRCLIDTGLHNRHVDVEGLANDIVAALGEGERP